MKSESLFVGMISFLAILATAFVPSACQGASALPRTYALSRTLTKAEVAGPYAYLKLVENGAAADAPALYSTRSAHFSAGVASYSITGIKAGTYTGWVFIDMNADVHDTATAMPDLTDYAVLHGITIDVSIDETLNINDSSWQLWAPIPG